MRIDHVTFSKSGGAGEVATVLSSAQKKLGADAKLTTLIFKDLRAEPLSSPAITLAAGLDQFAVSSGASPTIISLFRGNLSQLKHSEIRGDSIIHLHWIPGVVTHFEVKELLAQGRRVVWTLHDMVPFTGVCHHSHGCDGFKTDCRNCPQVRGPFRGRVQTSLRQKIFEIAEPNLLVVAPTAWLASQAKSSTVFRNQNIVVIENPIRPEFFNATMESEVRISLSRLSQTKNPFFTLTSVASDLQNPAKGITELIEIVRQVRGQGTSVRLQLVGRRGESFHDPKNGVDNLGHLSATELVGVARLTDILVSSSMAESAGLVVREFGAAGVPSLALKAGGIADLISDGESGLLADDYSDLSSKLQLLSSQHEVVKRMGTEAQALALNAMPMKVAQQYLDAYRGLLP